MSILVPFKKWNKENGVKDKVEINKQVGASIAKYRKASGLSQAKCHIDKSVFIQNISSALYGPFSLHLLVKILSIFSI